MTQTISDRRDIEFVLHEQLDISEVTKSEKFQEFNNKKTINMIVNEARNLAIKEILPTNKEGDEEGCFFEDGEVKVPKCYHRVWDLIREGEWLAMTEDPAVGGQGMPRMLSSAVSEMFSGANISFMIYPGLALGAGELVSEFGTEKQKELYLKKMYSGEWGGSMLLTEPEAGSDVGALTTSAKLNGDGTYSLTGNKIFITGAEQDLTENIIHPVLARIEGAPEGTKGISLFAVPKYWVNDDGSLGEKNDIVVTGIEHKMGLKGSATCSVTLGGKGTCRGTLLGGENKGMSAMFRMMNGARMGTGIQGFAQGSAAYLHALKYARERVQGKNLLSMFDKNAPAVEIINHPDVRRMLIHMKANVDGMRSFIYYVSKCFDMVEITEDPEQKEFYQGMIELLTPVIKAYCTDRGMDVTSTAVQCFGGYGYTNEYPVEQLMRDTKITQLYEGTNGIQAADLLGRKLAMKEGKVFMGFMSEIQKTIAQAKAILVLEELAVKLGEAVDQLGQTALLMGKTAMSENVLTAFSFAHPFLEVVGDVIMAWMHLWRASIAVPKIEKLAGSLEPRERRAKAEKSKDLAYYEGLLTTAEYYIKAMLPVTLGKMNSISASSDAAVAMPNLSFGEI